MSVYNTSSLLLPREVVEEVVNGAAELIIEKRCCETKETALWHKKEGDIENDNNENNCTATTNFKDDDAKERAFIHIFDEDERREKLSETNCPENIRAIHNTKLRQLQWARSTLLADERIRAFVPSSSPALWPDVEKLMEVINVVKVLKEFIDIPSDPRGATRLQEALQIIHNESRYAGVHPLVHAPVAGTLSVYKEMQEQEEELLSKNIAKLSSLGSQESKHYYIHDSTLSVRPVQWLLEISRVRYILSDAIRLPMTAKARHALLRHLLSRKEQSDSKEYSDVDNSNNKSTNNNNNNNNNISNNDNSEETVYHTHITSREPHYISSAKSEINKLLQMLVLHRESLMRHHMALFYTVQDALRTFNMTENELALLMERVVSTNKVRIRGGVYATVIQRPELFVLNIIVTTATTTTSTMSSDKKSAILINDLNNSDKSIIADNNRERTLAGKSNALTSEEHKLFYELAGMSYDAAVAKRLVLHSSERSSVELEQLLRERFLSPVISTECKIVCDKNNHCNFNYNNSNGYGNGNEDERNAHSNNTISSGDIVKEHKEVYYKSEDSKSSSYEEHSNTVIPCDKIPILVSTYSLGSEIVVKHIQCTHNPFIIVHGTRVEDGFSGHVEMLESLKRQRDAVAEEQTERLLRGEYNKLLQGQHKSSSQVSSHTSVLPQSQRRADTHVNDGGILHNVNNTNGNNNNDDEHYLLTNSTNRQEDASVLNALVTQKKSVQSSSLPMAHLSSSVTSTSDTLSELGRAVISILSNEPATRAELTHHPRLAQWMHQSHFDILLKNVLKSHAEYRGRKYHLRDEGVDY